MPITRVRVLRVSLALGTAIAAATLSLVAQGPAPGAQPAPAPAETAPPAQAAPGGQPPPGGAQGAQGRGRGPSMMEPDFSKKPPVLPLTPAEEAKKFLLPPGFKMELVLFGSGHRRISADRIRRQRPHVRARVARVHAECRRRR